MVPKIERTGGILLVISAPSGGGKSAVLKSLLAEDPRLGYSISYTSRAPRADESDGKHYNFVTRERFQEMIAAGDFYEHAEVHGNLYGTSAPLIESLLEGGRDVALDIDIQGGVNVKRKRPDAVLVFLMPPSMEILEKRLRGRASDAEDQIRLRMKNALEEIRHWPEYDYVVVNEVLEETLWQVKQILGAERRRVSRLRATQ